jgi:hypothetical protein
VISQVIAIMHHAIVIMIITTHIDRHVLTIIYYSDLGAFFALEESILRVGQEDSLEAAAVLEDRLCGQ